MQRQRQFSLPPIAESDKNCHDAPQRGRGHVNDWTEFVEYYGQNGASYIAGMARAFRAGVTQVAQCLSFVCLWRGTWMHSCIW